MRIAITLVIEMSDAQVADYAEYAGIPQQATGHFRAKDIVEDVRGYVRNCVQDSAAFGDGAADISIKR
jgi:hypothetical protein